MPGFVNCHYHSELAIGPGLYQHIFEKANVYIQGAVGPDRRGGPLLRDPVGADHRDQGRADRHRRHVLRPAPGCEHFGCVPALQAYDDSGPADRVRPGQPGPEHLRARGGRGVPGPAAGRRSPPRSAASPMGYAWPVDDVMASVRARCPTTGTAGTTGSGSSPRPTGRPPAPTSSTGAASRAADDHGTSLITHALETRSEMLFSLERYGKPAVRRLADLGVLGPRDGARALRLGHRRRAGRVRRLGRGGVLQPRLEPAAGRPGSAGSATSWPRAAGSASAPTASRSPTARTSSPELRLASYLQRLPRDVRRGPAGQRGAAARGGGQRRPRDRRRGQAGQPGARQVGGPARRAQGPDLLPARPVRRRAVPGRGPRPGRVRATSTRSGARPGADGGRAGHGRGRGPGAGPVRGGGARTGSTTRRPRSGAGPSSAPWSSRTWRSCTSPGTTRRSSRRTSTTPGG